jgi:TolA-binding protein
MAAFLGKKYAFISIFILIVLTGCSSTLPNDSLDVSGSGNSVDVEALKSIIYEQGKKISSIEKDLIQYQDMIDDQSNVLDIYDDNNQNVREFRRNLEREVQTAIEQIQDGSFEKEMTNTLIKIQNKIHILEDRTFYTDSLYFELVNDIVMIENEIASLISSFKEMSEISGKRQARVIPKLTNEEYQAKYIESLSNYQNGEWNTSLDGFKFLIQADSNHDLADNCQYWIGEVYYSLKEYKRSIKEFEKVFTFPGTNKADDAQFKLGLCYVNIKQIDKAKQEFENLLEFYPNSEYYKRSQETLKKY